MEAKKQEGIQRGGEGIKIRERWFPTLDVMILNQPMYYRENIGKLIDMITKL